MLPVKEASDGYIFSKSIHGRNLSEKEKKWVVLENDQNVWVNHTDKNGKLLYRLKSCVDTFSYQFKETDPETGKETVTMFSVNRKTNCFLQIPLWPKNKRLRS